MVTRTLDNDGYAYEGYSAQNRADTRNESATRMPGAATIRTVVGTQTAIRAHRTPVQKESIASGAPVPVRFLDRHGLPAGSGGFS